MTAITYDEETFEPPRRRRRRLLNAPTVLLLAVLVGGLCFYAGVRVEKGQVGTSSGGGAAGAFSSRLAARPGTGTSSSTASASARGAASGAPASGAPGAGGFGGAFAGGGNGAFGTVSSISHGALYVADASGNTVKISLSSVTKVSKSLTVSRKAIRPGDSVVVLGARNAKGTLIATSVSDSGASGSSGSSSRSSTSSGSGGQSAVNSLFGSGGGG